MDIHVLGRQAVALHQQGRLAEAEALYRQIIATAPRLIPPLYLLGVLRLEQGDSAEAVALIGRALAVNSREPAAQTSYGVALIGQGQFVEAVAAFDQALALQPGNVAALIGRGVAHKAMGRAAEALADYEAALALDPGNADGWNARGMLLRGLSRIDDALDSFNRAITLWPNFAEALANRGELLLNATTDYRAALADMEKAAALNPENSLVTATLLSVRTALAVRDCDWDLTARLAAELPHRLAAGEVFLPLTLIQYSGDEKLQLQCARTMIHRFYPAALSLSDAKPYGHDRIRLAYISSDFGRHPVSAQIAELIEQHDRTRFEVLGISTEKDDRSTLRRRLAGGFEQFYDVHGQPPLAVAERIRALEIDVLVDLNGHTQNGNFGILRHRPAPVQATWLGFAGTTGAPYIDYLIADRIVAPDPAAFSECIATLPFSFFPTDTQRPLGTAPSRAQAGLPETGFVFCCFNQHLKLTAPVFDIWMRLLGQVPGSILWLRHLDPDDIALARLKQAAADRGIDPYRLIFAPFVEKPQDYLARHALADLFLDTLPYNAHATACDALWAGLPVLTCLGSAFAGRVSASLLQAAGLPELVARTAEEYEALALALARDPAKLKGLRDRLAANRATAPLFNTPVFARNIEAAYEEMHARSRRGEPPAAFSVAPIS